MENLNRMLSPAFILFLEQKMFHPIPDLAVSRTFPFKLTTSNSIVSPLSPQSRMNSKMQLSLT